MESWSDGALTPAWSHHGNPQTLQHSITPFLSSALLDA